MKRLPIKAAKDLAEAYDQEQVILVTWDAVDKLTHVVTYGKTLAACEQAAQGGNTIKKMLGFPDAMCHDEPARIRRKRNA